MADPTGVTTPPRKETRGRKTLLTPQLQAEIIKVVELGDSDVNACACVGIASATLYQWIDKGTDHPATEDRPARPARSPYREFVEALQRARALWRRNLLAHAASAVQGPTTTFYRADGTVERVERKAPDGRLAMKLLAVRYPDEFSERRILEQRHTNATGQGPVVVATGGDLATAIAELAKLPEEVRDALAGVGGGLAPDDDG